MREQQQTRQPAMYALLQRVLATPPILAICHAQSVTPATRESLHVLDSALRHLQSYTDIKRQVSSNPLLARALLLADNLDAILTHRFSLDTPRKRVMCAIALEVACQADDKVFVTREFVRTMQAQATDKTMLRDYAAKVIAEEACKMTDQIGITYVPAPCDYLWLLDAEKKSSHKPRNLLFVEGLAAAEKERAFMAVLYGLNSSETSRFIENGADPHIARKIAAARLQLAAGIFPEPAQFSESGKKRWPSWLPRFWNSK